MTTVESGVLCMVGLKFFGGSTEFEVIPFSSDLRQ